MSLTIHDAAGLVAAGLVPADREESIAQVAARYAIAITPAMADLVDRADLHDPIALQFVPDPAELVRLPQEREDPIGDEAHSPVEGVVHRYPDRVLLKLLHACPVYCRFCFRRETVGGRGPATLSAAALRRALAYVRADPGIWEVILTGGDPLALSPRRLGPIMAALGEIGHVRVVRIHTRVPLVDPARVTPALVASLRRAARSTWIAVHANHPREFTAAGEAALARLADAGFSLISQTVLLRDVNDSAEVLAALMRRFVENRVKPYYLHHADLAPGTARFRTTIEEGQAIMAAMRGRISGLCQPAYVLDIPGGHGKSPIGPVYLKQKGGQAEIEDFQGLVHPYLSQAPAQRKPDFGE